MEAIKRQVGDEFQSEFGEDAATEVEIVENEDMAENEAMASSGNVCYLGHFFSSIKIKTVPAFKAQTNFITS